jgi:hypothetical protein
MSPALVSPQRTGNASQRQAERDRKVDLGGNLEREVSNRSPASKGLKRVRTLEDKKASNCAPYKAVAELTDKGEQFSKEPPQPGGLILILSPLTIGRHAKPFGCTNFGSES